MKIADMPLNMSQLAKFATLFFPIFISANFELVLTCFNCLNNDSTKTEYWIIYSPNKTGVNGHLNQYNILVL